MGCGASTVANITSWNDGIPSLEDAADIHVGAHLIDLVYCLDSPVIDQTIAKLNISSLTDRFLEKGSIRYMIVQIKNDPRCFVSIRGTANTKNAITDADMFNRVEDRDLPGVPLHPGFAAYSRAIIDDLVPQLAKLGITAGSPMIPFGNNSVDDVKEKDHRKSHSGAPLVIMGHSLGGAGAKIVGAVLKKAGFYVTKNITFGQPKVTVASNVHALNYYVGHCIRVVNDDDPIPRFPLQTAGNEYVHCGVKVVLNDNGEIVLPSNDPTQPRYGWKTGTEGLKQAFREMAVSPKEHRTAEYIRRAQILLEFVRSVQKEAEKKVAPGAAVAGRLQPDLSAPASPSAFSASTPAKSKEEVAAPSTPQAVSA